MRDAAYESLLKGRRRALHGKIAAVLAADHPDTPPELLAQHCGAGGLAREAAGAWLLAGDRMARRGANREAIAQLRRGLMVIEQIEDGPARRRLELDLVMTLGGCLRTLKGWMDDETVEAVFRARRLSDQLDDTPYRGMIGIGEYTVHLMRCELDKTVEIGHQLVDLAQCEDSDVAPYVGHRSAGIALFHKGRLKGALDHLEQGLACYDPSLERDIVHRIGYFSGVALHTYLAHVLWHLGRPDDSTASFERAVALDERHPPSQAFAYFQAGYHFGPSMRGDAAATGAMIERFRPLARDGGFATRSAFVEALAACLRCERGDTAGALEETKRNLDWWKAHASRLVVPAFHLFRARAEACLDLREAAVASLEAGLAWSRQFGEGWLESELVRAKGDLLRERVAREACYREAIALARACGSVTFERWASDCLSRLS